MGERIKVTANKPLSTKENSASNKQKTGFRSQSSHVDQILFLQRTIGNQAVQRLIKSGALQAKLMIGQPGDKYEQEADRVAEAVMRMPEPGVQRQVEEEEKKKEEEKLIQTKPLSEQITPLVQKQVEEEEEEELIQTKPLAAQVTPLVQRQIEEEEEKEEEELLQTKRYTGQASEVTSNLESRVKSLKGNGQPLPEADRGFMERRFGVYFSGVRMHTDSNAIQMNRELNAEAFTYGKNIYFGAGRYNPSTSSGKRILAHELTHVVQQNGGIGGIEIRRESSSKPRKNLRGVVSEIYQKSVGHGIIQRIVELHVNLRGRQKVKVHNSIGSSVEYLISAGRGNLTSRLIRRRHYPIIAKVGPPPRKTYRWGLQYYAQITNGGIGFHSDIAYPFRSTLCSDGIRRYCRGNQSARVRYVLIVDGRPRSHGCIRLSHNNASNLFNRVRVGTRVYIYSRRRWRPPSWSSSPNRALP